MSDRKGIFDLFGEIGFDVYAVNEIDFSCSPGAPGIFDVRGAFTGKRKNNMIPTRILKSGDRTIVFWKDGAKTIVKRAEGEPDNDYAAYTAALGIKLYGSNSALKRIVERTEVQKAKKKDEGEVLRAIEEIKEGNRAPYTQNKGSEGVAVCPDCGRTFKVQKGD